MRLTFQISRDSAGQKSKLVSLVRKFSNQILQEIKAFSDLFKKFKEERRVSERAVLTDSREYPPREDFEPDGSPPASPYQNLQENAA